MHTKVIKRRQSEACSLRDGMFLDFDDGEPSVISEVRHLAHKVLFTARNTAFNLDKDEVVFVATIMKVVGD